MRGLTITRRFLSLQSLLVWQGGFVFYSAFVVPAGTEVLGSASAQGAVSQQAAWWLNACGTAWVAFTLWDFAAEPRVARGRHYLAVLMAVTLLAQWLLHPVLGRSFDAELVRVTNRAEFRLWHVTYLWCATVTWLAGLTYTYLMVADWSRQERLP